MKYQVIVVDDESLIARNIAKNIERVNPAFEVIQTFSYGTEALNYIHNAPPHLVFTDIRMPEMDGIALTKYLSEEYPFIECVIVTGYNDFNYARSALKHQVKDYLLKPIDKEELRICLATIETRLKANNNALINLNEQDKEGWKPEAIVEFIREYIHQHYKDALNLTELADKFGFSSAYLSKVFLKHVNITPSKYIKNYRIKIAKQLLLNPNITIATVSQATGFIDPFHFSKTFKSVTGFSPTEYRVNHFDKS